METFGNSNEGRQKLKDLKDKLERIKKARAGLQALLDSKGLDREFIDNLLSNVFGGAQGFLGLPEDEILNDADNVELLKKIEGRFDIAENYIKLLLMDEKVLLAEAGITMSSWRRQAGSPDFETEYDHAKRIIRENKK
jgi:hypothetical protein